MLSLFTHLGDARLLLPASVALFFWLRLIGDRKGAAVWLITLVACLALTVAAKLLFYKCGWRVGTYKLSSPSGHMSLGITFFGSCVLLAMTSGRVWRWVVLASAVAALLSILGYSRVALSKHTVPEVFVGCAIGLGCLALFYALRTRARLPGEDLAPIFLGLVVGGAILAAWYLNMEPVIRAMAFDHDLSTGICSVVPLPR
jgi:hypothetical protein